MASMLSILDVLPRHERVNIGGDQEILIDVFGVSGEDVGKILERFPTAFIDLAKSGGVPSALDPSLIGAFLAASQRKKADGKTISLFGDDEAESAMRSLAVGAQIKLLQSMARCTFPDGLNPFLEGLRSISSASKEAVQIIVKAASKDQDMKLPPRPKPSDAPVTQASGS